MKLLTVVLTTALTAAYGALAKWGIDASWLFFIPLLAFPLWLGYVVGTDEDRAEYHKLKDWIIERLLRR